MILITNDKPIDSICCVCKDVAVAFDYLRTISSRSLRAVNFKYGHEQKWRDDNPDDYYGGFSDCEKAPNKWKYLVGDGTPCGYDTYYLNFIDYIE